MAFTIKNVTLVPQTVLTGGSVIVSVQIEETQLTIAEANSMTINQIQMVKLEKMVDKN